MERSLTRHPAAQAARRLLPSASGPGRVLRGVDRLERWPGADRLIDAVRGAVHAAPLGRGRDVLHGRWLGHPVHPLMVQVPLGTWLSAAVLDLLPGHRRGARTLIGVGLAAAGPSALAGWADWADLPKEQQRVGLVHAVSNLTAVALYASSYRARRRGQVWRGKALGLAGLSVVAAGGALGGHLAYRQAAGANHAEYVPHVVGEGWHEVGALAEFPVGRPVRRLVGEVEVMVVREEGGAVHVLADRCSHMAGPLSEGDIEDGCVRCPWHGSLFRLADGWNVEGPATAPQPSFDTRVTGGRLEVRLRRQGDEGRGAGAEAA
ncbi:Rieske 2Fe-2S domain-containing protein [Streptomyces sp. enrichment culture]|uniref:Rieske 2Fe-2S domain-containing protein n=1 Tax=Streptomyces sp. enrichment culture TaxID=1795815 RepID=UPI003F579702